MNYVQTLIQIEHSEIGMSDSAIALVCGVRRQHINDLKLGKKGASEKLIKVLENDIRYAREHKLKAVRKHYEYSSIPKKAKTPRATRAYVTSPSAPISQATRPSVTRPQTSVPTAQTNITVPMLQPVFPTKKHTASMLKPLCYVCGNENIRLYNVPERGKYRLCIKCASIYCPDVVAPSAQPDYTAQTFRADTYTFEDWN
jgi:hypothetical protein